MPSAPPRGLCRLQHQAPGGKARDRTGRTHSARPVQRALPTATGKLRTLRLLQCRIVDRGFRYRRRRSRDGPLLRADKPPRAGDRYPSITGRPRQAVLGDPFRDAVAHVVDAPVSRLPVQQAGSLQAPRSAMTDQGDRLSGAGNAVERPHPRVDIVVSVRIEEGQQMAAFDGAGLAPLLRRPDVDDRHAVRQQALESGAVDMDDFGAKRRCENEQRGAQGNRSQHGSILSRLVPFGWIFRSRRRRAAGAARSRSDRVQHPPWQTKMA